jgi:hypothetical protein
VYREQVFHDLLEADTEWYFKLLSDRFLSSDAI